MRRMSVSAKPPCSRGTGFYNAGLLAPDIQEAILEGRQAKGRQAKGRQAKGLQLEELMGAMPGAWESQRRVARISMAVSAF
jgi:hypothetical protein